jgi:hypothetical protein
VAHALAGPPTGPVGIVAHASARTTLRVVTNVGNLALGRGARFSVLRRSSFRRVRHFSPAFSTISRLGFWRAKGPAKGAAPYPRETLVGLRRYWEQLPATEVGRKAIGASSPLESMVPRSARHTVATTLTVMAGLIPIQRVSFFVRVLAVAGGQEYIWKWPKQKPTARGKMGG